MPLWFGKVQFDYGKKEVLFQRAFPQAGERFILKPKDYDELYHELNAARQVKKRVLDSCVGPVVYFRNVRLPQSSHKYSIHIVILRSAKGFEAQLRVHPLCPAGFIQTEVPDYSARNRGKDSEIRFRDLGFPILRRDRLLPLPEEWYPSPSAALTAKLMEEEEEA